MKKPTDILSGEHQQILKILNLLSEECNALENGKNLNLDFFNDVISFFIDYADKFHHSKEENILFVEFEKNSSEAHCNPVPQMIYEHELARDCVKNLNENLKTNDKSGIIRNSKMYVQLLRDHIFKEDNILYPMINETISTETQMKILEKFSLVEKDSCGIHITKKAEMLYKKLSQP